MKGVEGMTTEYTPKEKIQRLMWTEKGWTKDCQCGEKINYLSRICPYYHEGVKNDG